VASCLGRRGREAPGFGIGRGRVTSGDCLFELVHAAAQCPPGPRQALGTEDQQHEDHHDQDVGRGQQTSGRRGVCSLNSSGTCPA
jgi:hypothetical protein